MKVIRICLAVICLGLISGMTLAQEADSICWNENRKLKWTDFKGEPDTTELDWYAVCPAALEARGYWDSGLPNFLITNQWCPGKFC